MRGKLSSAAMKLSFRSYRYLRYTEPRSLVQYLTPPIRTCVGNFPARPGQAEDATREVPLPRHKEAVRHERAAAVPHAHHGLHDDRRPQHAERWR